MVILLTDEEIKEIRDCILLERLEHERGYLRRPPINGWISPRSVFMPSLRRSKPYAKKKGA